MTRIAKAQKISDFPYNPDDVNIRLQHFRVNDIVKMIKRGDLDIWKEDELQRLPNLWGNDKKSLFIESLLIKLPIPLFYLDGSSKPWSVIDGLQRLHAIMGFIEADRNKPFVLRGLEYLISECNGKSFEEIPEYLKARLLGAEIEAYVINPGTPPEVKYNIFKRINTGGLSLKGQEIRNALCRGIPANFTKELADEIVFIHATNYKVNPRRMEDREYATRFIAFQIQHYGDYHTKMDIFLTNALLQLYNYSQNDLKYLKSDYHESLKRCLDILGQTCFYRFNRDATLKSKKPIKAIFDTISWNFLKLSPKDFKKIQSHNKNFKKKYVEFMNDDEFFYKSINDTTGTKSSVITRFGRLEMFLKDFIQ